MVTGSGEVEFTADALEGLVELDMLQVGLDPDTVVESVFVDVAALRTSPVPYGYVQGRIRLTDPGPSDVGFNLALPARFGGRYLLNAQGGAGGALQDPPADLLGEGTVVAATDRGVVTGHVLDLSYFNDPARVAEALNSAGRAVHATAQVTQLLTRRYYGVEQFPRYIAGCSAGGISGWANVRREGTRDFDAVLAGDFPTPSAIISVQWARVAQHQCRHPESWIPPELLRAGEAAIVAAYDGVDGAVDGLIWDDRLIDFDLDVLRDAGFSEAQIGTFVVATSPWVYRAGVRPLTVPGLSFSRITVFEETVTGRVPPPWLGGAWRNDGDWRTSGVPRGLYVVESRLSTTAPGSGFIDLDLEAADVQRLFANTVEPWNDPADPFDLTDFRDGGGKLITYVGVANQSNAYLGKVLAWQAAARDRASLDAGDDPEPSGSLDLNAVERVNTWFRHYSVPGMMHCTGGPGPHDVFDQLLRALLAWVEDGVPPEDVVAENPSSGRTFLLCPEPQRAVYSGTGDVDDAANWRSRLEPRFLEVPSS